LCYALQTRRALRALAVTDGLAFSCLAFWRRLWPVRLGTRHITAEIEI
jgi:hypothetical protein